VTVNKKKKWVWWYVLVISATQKAEVGGSWSNVSLGKSTRPCVKKKLKREKDWARGLSSRALA
jgi:hypothetical protein